jgi:hypothetical protein
MKTDNTEISDLRVTPLAHEEAAELLAGYADTQEHWLIVCDGPGFRSIEPILRRFYGHGDDQDLFATVSWSGEAMFAVIVARRRRMSAEKLRFELQKQDFNISTRELVSDGALIRVADFNRAKAREFARTIGLAPQGDDLALES